MHERAAGAEIVGDMYEYTRRRMRTVAAKKKAERQPKQPKPQPLGGRRYTVVFDPHRATMADLENIVERLKQAAQRERELN